jgi:hypothetical protein
MTCLGLSRPSKWRGWAAEHLGEILGSILGADLAHRWSRSAVDSSAFEMTPREKWADRVVTTWAGATPVLGGPQPIGWPIGLPPKPARRQPSGGSGVAPAHVVRIIRVNAWPQE